MAAGNAAKHGRLLQIASWRGVAASLIASALRLPFTTSAMADRAPMLGRAADKIARIVHFAQPEYLNHPIYACAGRTSPTAFGSHLFNNRDLSEFVDRAEYES